MNLKPATLDDLEFLFQLRNEPVNVKFSKRGTLTLEEVKEDYFEGNKDPFIFYYGDMRVGYVIYAPEGNNYEISVAIIPEMRGRDLGSKVIEEGTRYCLDNMCDEVIAKVLPTNLVSINAFEKAGYRYIGCEDKLLLFKNKKDISQNH